jgi:hypothetical protein
MLLYPAWLNNLHSALYGFATTATELLTRNDCISTLITEHVQPRYTSSVLSLYYESRFDRVSPETGTFLKQMRKRKGRPATQAAFSLRENSSNGRQIPPKLYAGIL